MRSLIRSIGSQLRDRFRLLAWFLTDSAWRRQYLAVQRPIRERQRARRAAIAEISAQTGNRVITGPFRGMQYVASWAGMHFTQKLAGTYEKELAGVVEEICGRTYGTVVNIGAADGYYACGLAFRLPDVKAIAFELRPEMGPLIRTIAKANRLDERVQIGGLCTSDALREAMTGGEPILVVCDIEGAEADLLDPILVPALLRADLLVEVHDHVRPNVSKLLADRFRASHVLDAIKPAPRVLGDWPAQLRLDPSLILKVMDEGRGTGISWLWMRSARPRQAQ